jgi:RimJ/RimL family protein N-acetyltransferase
MQPWRDDLDHSNRPGAVQGRQSMILSFPHRIQTARLVLRTPVLGDAPAIFERWAHDPGVVRYLTWRADQTVEEVHAFLRRGQAMRESGERVAWVLTLPGEDSPIGMLEARPGAHGVELGYVLGKSYWNHGYMTEAVEAVAAWLLDQPGVFRVWAVCDVENQPSARVLEKARFQREGVLRRWTMHPNVGAAPRDCLCYARVK